MLGLLLLAACQSDACRLMCADVALNVEACLDEWGASWEDLDATTRQQFGDRCREQWDALRLDLEPRQLDGANEECTDGRLLLDGAGDDDLTCDELRTLYFRP